MKAIYLNLQRIDGFSGYQKKVQSQIKSFKKHNIDIELVDQNRLEEKDASLSVLSTYKRRKAILSLCEKRIEEIKPDFIYVRYPCGDPVYYRFVKKYAGQIVSEHQTLETMELKAEKKRLKYWMEKVYGKKILGRIRGIVAVTGEIAKFQNSRVKNALPYHIMGNGIDAEMVPFDDRLPDYSGELNLLIVANINLWHGIDRVIKGIAAYQGTKKVIFHVVGNGGIIEDLKKLAADLGITDKIIFYGAKRGPELDEIYGKCHIGIGSLGIHRLGFTEGAVLKNREYCAKGLPFVYAFRDPDFKQDFLYGLELPQNDEGIEIQKIIDFYDDIRRETDFKETMRTYASKELSWDFKVKKIIEFIKSLEIS